MVFYWFRGFFFIGSEDSFLLVQRIVLIGMVQWMVLTGSEKVMIGWEDTLVGSMDGIDQVRYYCILIGTEVGFWNYQRMVFIGPECGSLLVQRIVCIGSEDGLYWFRRWFWLFQRMVFIGSENGLDWFENGFHWFLVLEWVHL